MLASRTAHLGNVTGGASRSASTAALADLVRAKVGKWNAAPASA